MQVIPLGNDALRMNKKGGQLFTLVGNDVSMFQDLTSELLTKLSKEPVLKRRSKYKRR